MKKVNNVVRPVLLLFLSLILALTPLSPLLATTPSLWISSPDPGFEIVQSPAPAQPIQQHAGEFCTPGALTISPSADGLPPYRYEPDCVVETQYGLQAHSFMKFEHTNEFIKLDTTSIGPLLIPNSDTLFYISVSGGSRYLYAHSNPAAKFSKQPGNSTWPFMYKTTAVPDWSLRDSNNSLVATKAYATSKNGRWLVIEVGGGIMRLDLLTKQFFKFTTEVPPYGTGKNPTLHMAVSNDGRYAAVGGLNYSGVRMYDLSTCSPPSQARSTSVATGCGVRDMTNFLKSKISNYVNSTYLEFNNDATQLSMNAGNRVLLQAPNTIASYLDYLALGDSFSSGEGTGAYLQGTDADGLPIEGVDVNKEKCHVSPTSYPHIISQSTGLDNTVFSNIACSGATSNDITDDSDSYSGQQGRIITTVTDKRREIKSQALLSMTPGLEAQTKFVEKYKPKAITLTIGGNDVGFADKLKACISSSCLYGTDLSTKKGVFLEIQNQFDKLTELYTNLHNASPKTKIYVLDYPSFMGNSACGINVPFNDDARDFIQQATSYMNDVIEQAAKKAGVRFVDIENSLAGKELCSGSSEIAFNGLKTGNDQFAVIGNESFHPNSLGYSLIANTFTDDVGNLLTTSYCANSLTVCPDTTITNAPALPSDIALAPKPEYEPLHTPLLMNQTLTKDASSPLQAEVQLTNLIPGSTIAFEIHSDPQPLGTAQVDTDGKLTTSLNIPSNIPAGLHTIHAYAVTRSGEKIDLYQEIAVLGAEGDKDEDGIDDTVDPCQFVTAAGVDEDNDGTDDACDPQIGVADPLGAITPAPTMQTHSSEVIAIEAYETRKITTGFSPTQAIT